MMTWPKPVQKAAPPGILGGAFRGGRRADPLWRRLVPNAASGEPEDYVPEFRKCAGGGREPKSLSLAPWRRGRTTGTAKASATWGSIGQRHAKPGYPRQLLTVLDTGRPYPPAARITGGCARIGALGSVKFSNADQTFIIEANREKRGGSLVRGIPSREAIHRYRDRSIVRPRRMRSCAPT